MYTKKYYKNSLKNVVMVVANGVIGDSRVIKTAMTLDKLGYKTILFGVSGTTEFEEVYKYPFKIVRVPNPKFQMVSEKLWEYDKSKRDWELYNKLTAESIIEYIELKNIDVDFLHSHDMFGLPIADSIKTGLNKNNIKWVHDIHEYVEGLTDLPVGLVKYASLKENQLISKPDKLTCVSEKLIDILKRNFNNVSIDLVYNTPVLSDFDEDYHRDIRNELKLGSDIPLGVYIGNVKPVRGVDTIIRAMKHSSELHVAILSNSDNELLKIRELAKTLGVIQRLHVLPYVEPYLVTSFIRSATFGIHPIKRYPNAEIALPNKIFEYMHAGLPVIVSNNNAMLEFVTEFNIGKVFKADDEIDLAIKLNEMIYESSDIYSDNQNNLKTTFNWESNERIIDQIYTELSENWPDKGVINKDLKVLHLPKTAASQPALIARSLAGIEIYSKSAAFFANKPTVIKSDIVLEKTRDASQFFQLTSKFNVFNYHADTFFSGVNGFWDLAELIALKSMGKKVFFSFRGSEIRRPSLFKQVSPYNYVGDNPNMIFDKIREECQIYHSQTIPQIVDACFVQDPELKTYCQDAIIVPRVVECFEPGHSRRSLPRKKIRVLHASTSDIIKGTSMIRDVIYDMKKEGLEFDFVELHGVSRDEFISEIANCDIYVDQMRIGWFGVAALEAMALGKPVISYVRADLKNYLGLEPPLIMAEIENLKIKLKRLITDQNLRQNYSKKAKKYILENHTPEVVAKKMAYLYSLPGKNCDASGLEDYFLNKGELSNAKKAIAKKAIIKKAIAKISYVDTMLFSPANIKQGVINIRDNGIKDTFRKAKKLLNSNS